MLIQEEQIKNWHSGLFGKQIQNTGIGGQIYNLSDLKGALISMLKQNIETLILVDRYKATTKICSRCGSRKEDITLSDRVYKCKNCGLIIDRDLNSAINILKIGLQKVEKTTIKNIPLDWWDVKPVERGATARVLGSNPYIRVSYTSVKQEAPNFS